MANIAIFRINYKSDFILTLNSDAGWMTPFCIKFWTGAPSQAYFVGFDGTTYTHCAPVDGEPTKLRVQFDDHHLPIGDLKYQIAYHFTVADFPNDTEDEVLNQANITTEIDGETYQVMLDFTGETAPEIQFALPAYANEAQRIANEQQRIANEQERIEKEQQRIAAEETRQAHEAQRIAQETARVNEFATLKSQSQAATRNANDAATLANQKAQLAQDKADLAQAAATLANQKAQLAADKAALANAAAQLANDKAALAQQKAEYAQQQGGYAKDQGDYAKNQGDYAKEQGDTALADHQRAEADHGIAVDDHTQAGNDHTRAEADHGIAVDDHTQAGNDHTRAESDHGIAVGDHTQAGNDHTRAESDHGIAVDDHTQAGNDHTRAESDHTRAESDHAAVEVYVDSLGVFDLSKHNAVGGVLATYADLSAALTALNALDSKYKYGGMSFKFVQSSDNNYVQYRYMSTSTANADFTNVANWQGVDNAAKPASKNLIESGYIYNLLVKLSDMYVNQSRIEIGETYYNTNIKQIRTKTAASTYIIHPYVDGAVYTYNNELYIWNGTELASVTLKDVYPILNSNNGVKSNGVAKFFADTLGYYYTKKAAEPGRVVKYLDVNIPNGAKYKVIVNSDTAWTGLGICDQTGLNGTNTHLNLVGGQEYEFTANGAITEIKVYLYKPASFSDDIELTIKCGGYVQEDIDSIKNDVSDIQDDVEEIQNELLGLTDNVNKNIEEDNELRETIIDPASVVALNFVSTPSSSYRYQFSTFSGYGEYIGEIQESFRYLLTKIKCADWGSNTNSVTKILVQFRQNDATGTILYSKTFDVNPVAPGVSSEEMLDFGEDVTLSGNVYMCIRMNAPSAICVGSTTYPYTTEQGRFWTGGNITESNTGNEDEYYKNGDLYWKLYKTLVLKVQLTDEQIANIQGRISIPRRNPQIVMPSVTYILKDNENSIYHKNYLEFWSPYEFGITRNDGSWKYLERCFRTSTSTTPISMRLFDVKTNETLQTYSASVNVGDPNTDNGNLVINVIGDSFTYDGRWFAKTNALCPNLTFTGMRVSYATKYVSPALADLKAEGRGGWHLAMYFTTMYDTRGAYEGFTPFMHPANYIYYGVVEFWRDIVAGQTSEHSYTMNGFSDYISMFDANGYKQNPQQGDLMYDFTNSVYKAWNGSEWAIVSETLTFVFDYSKYVQAWGIIPPDVVLIMLGVNDWWFSFTDSKKNTWNNRMVQVINSIRAYGNSINKTIKIGLCTNTTIPGTPNNNDNRNPFVRNSLYLGRKNLIDTFDTQEYVNNNVFVVDTGVCLDPDYGFELREEKPFTYYAGTHRELYDSNGCHPSEAGYYQIGTCVAGFIQYIR